MNPRTSFLALILIMMMVRPAMAMSVQDVLALHDAGINDVKIIELFNSDHTVFRLTSSEIVLLQKAGLSHELLREMILTQQSIQHVSIEAKIGGAREQESSESESDKSGETHDRFPGFNTYESPGGMKITPITPTLLTESDPLGAWWRVNQPVLYTPSWALSYPPYVSWGYPGSWWYGGGYWGEYGPRIWLPSHYSYRSESSGLEAGWSNDNWNVSLNGGLKVSYTDW